MFVEEVVDEWASRGGVINGDGQIVVTHYFFDDVNRHCQRLISMF